MSSAPTIDAQKIREETEADDELSQMKDDLLTGILFDPEITLHDGILFRGRRVIIPKSLRPAILQELHSVHVGIVKMKAIARNNCYWKNIDTDIERLVKSCRQCCNLQKNPKKLPVHVWDPPTRNWERLHIDYAGPFMGHHFFIVVDAKSKWPEIFAIRVAPTSSITIRHLRDLFSRHGLPDLIFSDNATIFKSAEFIQFCIAHGILQRFIAPGHPATNGQAERFCQILKRKLKSLQDEPGTVEDKLNALLFSYRTTPLASGKTPAENFMGRPLKTKLDLLRPTEPRQRVTFDLPESRVFRIGDRVLSRNYSRAGLWKLGKIIKCLGNRHYIVQLDTGYTLKRHADQLRTSEVEATESSGNIAPFIIWNAPAPPPAAMPGQLIQPAPTPATQVPPPIVPVPQPAPARLAPRGILRNSQIPVRQAVTPPNRATAVQAPRTVRIAEPPPSRAGRIRRPLQDPAFHYYR